MRYIIDWLCCDDWRTSRTREALMTCVRVAVILTALVTIAVLRWLVLLSSICE